MNPKFKLFAAVVLAGMFLVPPGAAMASELGTGSGAGQRIPSQVESPVATGSLSDRTGLSMPEAIPNGDITATPTLMPVSREPYSHNLYTRDQEKASGARGPRAGPDAELIFLDVVWPAKVDQWTFAGIFALKGATTTFNVTVNNSGTDPTTGAVTVVFAIQDFFGKDMTNQTQNIGSLGSGLNKTLYFDWTPAYCTYFMIVIITTTNGDADSTNDFNRYGMNGNGALLGVALWVDNCNDMSYWTGIGAGSTGTDRNWHISDSPENENGSQHTGPNSLYEGKEGGIITQDNYENNKDISVKTPNFDLRRFSNAYYGMGGVYWASLNFNYLFHGAMPAADAGDILSQDMSTDNGASWKYPIASLDGPGLVGAATLRLDWYSWFADINGDGLSQINEVGLKLPGDLAGNMMTLRNKFVSNQAITDIGIYMDDFIIWGLEIQYDVQVDILSDLASPFQNENVPVTAKVTNTGGTAQPAAFNATLNVTRRGTITPILYNEVQPINALAVGATQQVTFNWTPDTPGDYIVVVNETGAKDENGVNNRDVRVAHVSSASPQMLLVDDNPFGSPLNTTDALVAKLTAIYGAENFGIYYTTWKGALFGKDYAGDGPSPDLMKKFDVVIWTTGWDNWNETLNATLTANDQANIKTYLNAGGALWLISMGVINDLNGNSFVKNTLHVSAYKNDTQLKGEPFRANQQILPQPLNGTAGGLAEGVSYYTNPPFGTNWSYDETDLIQPDAEAMGVFDGTPGAADMYYVAIQHASTYRLVFQTFDLAFIQMESEREAYIKLVVGYLTGGLMMESPSSSQMVDPGGEAVYMMTLTNGGTKTRALWNIETTQPPAGWTVTTDPAIVDGDKSVDLAAGESVDIKLTVKAPAKALAATVANIDLTVGFQNYVPTLVNRTRTEVRAIVMTELIASIVTQNLTSPGPASYSFTVRNLGNLQITAELTKSGDYAESLTLGSYAVSLQPYEDRLVSAVLTVPEGPFRQAGNYTLRDTVNSRVTYQGMSHNATLNLTTNLRIQQIFSVKLDDVPELTPSDGQVDMSVAKPSAKVTVRLTAPLANGYDNVTVELKAKSFTPTGGTSRNWGGADWTLPRTVVATTPFMNSVQETQLTVFVPVKADAGEFAIEVRVTPGNGRITDGDTAQISLQVAKPDLTILAGSLVFKPAEPEVGTPVTIKVTVKNMGGVRVRDVDVSFFTTGENLIETKRITELAATTGSAPVEITWEGILEGENEITVRVDPANLFSEMDETNNEITETVVGYRSDLVIDEAPTFLKEGKLKNSVTVGDTVIIKVTVKNLGTYGLNLTGVTVRLTDQTTGETQTQTIALNTRSSQEVQFTWSAQKAKTHTFAIRVNPDGAIREKSLDNNEMTAELKVAEKPKEGGGLGGMTLYIIVGVVAIVVVVALAAVMMRRKPASRAPPAEEKVDVVEAETVEAEGEKK